MLYVHDVDKESMSIEKITKRVTVVVARRNYMKL